MTSLLRKVLIDRVRLLVRTGCKPIELGGDAVLLVKWSTLVVLVLEDLLLVGHLSDLLPLVGLDVGSDLISHLLAISFSVIDPDRCHHKASWRHAFVNTILFVGRVRIHALHIDLGDARPGLFLVHILEELQFLLKAGTNLDAFLHYSLVLPIFEVKGVKFVDVGGSQSVNRHLLALGATPFLAIEFFRGLRTARRRDLVLSSTSFLCSNSKRFLCGRVLVRYLDSVIAVKHIDGTKDFRVLAQNPVMMLRIFLLGLLSWWVVDCLAVVFGLERYSLLVGRVLLLLPARLFLDRGTI